MRVGWVVLGAACLAACGEAEPPTPAETKMRSLEVTATAYTSSRKQTDSTPYISAFNQRLQPGEKVIAVSRDLEAMGLTRGNEVKIEGLEGTYRVGDRTNKRWKKRIDLYMGNDREAALQWGKQRVTIHWRADP
ncbi:MAG: 3D domain-containing protein [Phycisphaeraceae bacterium]